MLRWYDCHGVELHEGDIVRDIDSGKEEPVYACHPKGYPEELNLGLNASNEKWLENHPDWPREVYPFNNFAHTACLDGNHLKDYEKVVR